MIYMCVCISLYIYIYIYREREIDIDVYIYIYIYVSCCLLCHGPAGHARDATIDVSLSFVHCLVSAFYHAFEELIRLARD